jgi:hypothetical protein
MLRYIGSSPPAKSIVAFHWQSAKTVRAASFQQLRKIRAPGG